MYKMAEIHFFKKKTPQWPKVAKRQPQKWWKAAKGNTLPSVSNER